MQERAPGFLAALQLSDSALPIGRFIYSGGLEAMLEADPTIGEGELVELVQTSLVHSVGPLDGVTVAEAHHRQREADLQSLLELDRLVTARKLTPASRISSTSCGNQLAALSDQLVEDEIVAELCASVRQSATDGNLAVVEGALAASLDIGCEEAVLLELRGAASTFFSTAIRLGRMSARRAQGALRHCVPAITEAADLALNLSVGEMYSVFPELEIYALRHERAEIRLFTT